MAFPVGTETATTLAVMIPTVWGEKMNEFFKEQLIMADFFTNRSEELSSGGNTLLTPNISQMGATAKANATAVNLNSPTETNVTLVVNQWYESSFAIEDVLAKQVKQSYVLQKKYAKNAAFSIGQVLEKAIANLFLGFSGSVGTATTNLSDVDIREAIATMETAKVPGVYGGDVAFFLHPNTFWRQVQGIDKFSLAINSPVNDPTAKKPAGSLYGIPVYTTPNVPNVSGVTGRVNVLAHKDAIHWATTSLDVMTYGQGSVGSYGVRVQSSYIPDYLSTVTTADICYGVIENRDICGVRLLSHETSV